jgi:hypothetical protein
MKSMRRDLSQAGYRVLPFSNVRRQQIDWLDLMQRQHTIHALLEVDVTDARPSIRRYRAATHDIIDGAPAARFASHLRELIEGGVGLTERREGPASASPPDLP